MEERLIHLTHYLERNSGNARTVNTYEQIKGNVARSRRSNSGGADAKHHAYYLLATLRASRVFSRRSPTIRTPGTG